MGETGHAPQSDALRELQARGFFEQASDVEAVDRAFAAGQVTFYTGYDPTARSLHVGNLVTIMAMRRVQQHGHRPIVIVGGGTAMVGDPSGKSETRKMLTPEQIADNAAAIKAQIGKFVHFDTGADNDAMLLNNADWLSKLGYVEFLRDVGRHFTVNRMIAAKTYRDRLEAELPLSFLEFNYQLLQAYDFLHLYRELGCTLQLGGADQWGNMIAGVELIRRVMHAEGVAPEARDVARCLTYPLLTTADGRKMGKTEKGAVWLDGDALSPFDYYQFWINVDDRDVGKLLHFFTELDLEETGRLAALEGAAIREAKAKLAFEATRLCHGEQAARRAEAGAKQAFGGGEDWSAVACVDLPCDPQLDGLKLVDVVVNPDVAAFKSKREARQRIEGGAVKIDGAPVTDPNQVLPRDQVPGDGHKLQAGKKRRHRIKLVAP